MYCTFTIVRYPKWAAFFGFLSMAVFHFFLKRNKNISFYKLMGSGKNGTFDVVPDLQQWAILAAFTKNFEGEPSTRALYGRYINNWWKRFNCEVLTIGLQPTEGHGTWDGKECFGQLPKNSDYKGPVAVLTRATIRATKVKNFWKNVGIASAAVQNAPGFITSFGVGEIPWIKQATFSVWQNKDLMKSYAYKMREHQQVIQKTRTENWYSEEMFVRFKLLWTSGAISNSKSILQSKV